MNATRKIALKLLLANHPDSCHDCEKNNRCDLQYIAAFVGVEREELDRMRHTTSELPVDTSNPFFDLDPYKCVLCGICIRTCDEIQGVNALEYLYRGFQTKVGTFGDKPIVP